MNTYKRSRHLLPALGLFSVVTLLLFAVAVRPSQAAVGDLTFTIEAPRVQSSQVTCNAGLVVENFDSQSVGAVVTVDLATGTYDQGSGAVIIAPADNFGGAGGSGNYIRTDIARSYSLTVDTTAFPQGAGYVGFWWSAGDGENTVTVNMADGSSQTFDTQTILDSAALVGTPGVYDGHFGNPNLIDVNPDEVYAFVNIFAGNDNARIKSLVFAEKPSGAGAFESDNHSLCADLLDPNTGTPVPQTGTINIVKAATPEDDTSFGFQFESPFTGFEAFWLTDPSDNTKTYADIPAGTYGVIELPPQGWTLTDITCDDSNSGGDPAGLEATINLDGGEEVTCTFTNEQQLGTITIVKDADPDDGTQFEFDQNIDSSGVFSLVHSGSKSFSDVVPATYRISETVPNDWYLSLVSCVAASGNDVDTAIDYVNDWFDVTLEAGEDVTCTVSNKQFATLTIKKETVGGDDTFNFTSPFFPVNSFDLTTVGGTAERTFGELPSNVTPYEVNETPQPGWVLTDASCDNGDTPDEVFLAPGDDVTCTFTNEKLGSITVVKDADPADDTEFDFGITGDNVDVPFTLQDPSNPSYTESGLVPGAFAVGEVNLPAGWTATDIVCQSATGDSEFLYVVDLAGVNVDLAPGDDVTCTFTNERQFGTINIVKQTAPAGGTGFGFTDDIEQPNSFTLDDGQTKTFLDVVPGQYTVTEDDPGVGVFLSGLVCDDANSATPSTVDLGAREATINLDPGETVTCTYTNTAEDIIVIAKLTEPAGGFNFGFTSSLGDFSLDDGEFEFFEVQQPGTFTFMEDDPGPDYALTDLECAILKPEQDPIFVDGNLVNRSVDVMLDGPGQAAFCLFVNSLTNACPVDPNVGNELTDLFGTGMGSPTRQAMMRKLTVPNAGNVTELYAQMAAKEYTAVRYVRFIFGDKSYIQVQPETDLGEKAAISWWGEDITTEFQAQAKPQVKGRWFLNKGMRKMKAPRAFVLYPTYQTAEEYANAWSTFGAPDNFVAGTPGFDQTNSNILPIPELQVATDVTVELAVTDVNRDQRTVDVTVSAGGVSETVTLTGPTTRKSELLNIFTVTLENVPAGTDEVEILMESVLGSGDSAALLGAAANYACEVDLNGNP